jgi:hypothetical protein
MAASRNGRNMIFQSRANGHRFSIFLLQAPAGTRSEKARFLPGFFYFVKIRGVSCKGADVGTGGLIEFRRLIRCLWFCLQIFYIFLLDGGACYGYNSVPLGNIPSSLRNIGFTRVRDRFS